MKQLYSLILFGLFSICAKAQCSDEAFHMITLGYQYDDGNVATFEIGKTGNESNWSGYIGTNVYFGDRRASMVTDEVTGQKHEIMYPMGGVYGKAAYRVFRQEYMVSIYVNAIAGYDLGVEGYGAASLRILFPIRTMAVSVETTYFPMRGKVTGTVNLHFSL